jgi:hypothetical protein
MNDSKESFKRSTLLGMLGVATMVATYIFSSPSLFNSETAGTALQWQQLCSDSAQSCSVLKTNASGTSYRACGLDKCFSVACLSGPEDRTCVKQELVGERPPPRKLRTIVGSIL